MRLIKVKEVIKMNTVLEMQKLVPDREEKGRALGEIVPTFSTSVGKSSFSIFMCS